MFSHTHALQKYKILSPCDSLLIVSPHKYTAIEMILHALVEIRDL